MLTNIKLLTGSYGNQLEEQFNFSEFYEKNWLRLQSKLPPGIQTRTLSTFNSERKVEKFSFSPFLSELNVE